MKSMDRKLIMAGIAVIALVTSAAVATAYYTQTPKQVTKTTITAQKTPHRTPPQKMASAGPVQQQCDDSNVLGYIAGGAGGGIVGNQIGKGSGNTAATIAGVLGGAYLGGQYIPLRNATCRQ